MQADSSVTYVGDIPLNTMIDLPERVLVPHATPSQTLHDMASESVVQGTGVDSGQLSMGLDPVILIPPSLPPLRERFQALQKWEGYVIEVGQDTFHARLIPIRGEKDEELEAEIYLEELDEEDRGLLAPGSVFYWSIGYLDGPSGRRRHSILRLRRLPGWTERDIETARRGTEKLKALFDATQ